MTEDSIASPGDLVFRPEPLEAISHYAFPRSAAELLPWSHHLENDARATVHLESAEDVVIVEGAVRDVILNPESAARIADAWGAKYGSLIPDATHGIYQLLPSRARGWSRSSLRDGTRWARTQLRTEH